MTLSIDRTRDTGDDLDGLRATLESVALPAPTALLLGDLSDDTIVWINDRAEEMLGVSRDALPYSAGSFVHLADRPVVRMQLDALRTWPDRPIEALLRVHADGEMRWTAVRLWTVLGRDPHAPPRHAMAAVRFAGAPLVASAVWSWLDEFPEMVFVYSRSKRRFVFANRPARAGLDAAGVAVPDGLTIAHIANRDRPAVSAFFAALHEDRMPEPLVVQAPSGRLMVMWRISAPLGLPGDLRLIGAHHVDHAELQARGPKPLPDALSRREREVVTLLLDGLRIPTIAARLFVSRNTVRNHLRSVYAKLGVGSQAELVAFLRD